MRKVLYVCCIVIAITLCCVGCGNDDVHIKNGATPTAVDGKGVAVADKSDSVANGSDQASGTDATDAMDAAYVEATEETDYDALAALEESGLDGTEDEYPAEEYIEPYVEQLAIPPLQTVKVDYSAATFIKNDNTVWNAFKADDARQLADDAIYYDAIFYTKGLDTEYYISTKNELYCKGINEQGQIGDGTTTDRDTFVKVLDNVAMARTVDRASMMALTLDGGLWRWGTGEAGSDDEVKRTVQYLVPTRIAENIAVLEKDYILTREGALADVDFEGIRSFPLSFVRKYYGTVNLNNGELGTLWIDMQDNLIQASREYEVLLTNVRDVFVDKGGTWRNPFYAITHNDELYTWGQNYNGKLGDGIEGPDRSFPSKVMDGVTDAGMTQENDCYALKFNGDLYMWNNDKIVPTKYYENVAAAYPGERYVFALFNDGTLCRIDTKYITTSERGYELTHIADNVKLPIPDMYQGYGNNMSPIADGSETQDNRNENLTPSSPLTNPVQGGTLGIIPDSNTFFEYWQSGRFSWAVRGDGNLYQVVGDGNLEEGLGIPIAHDVRYATGDRDTRFIITNNDELYACGENKSGRAGMGDMKGSATPIKILDNVAKVWLEGSTGIALKRDKTLYVWGNNPLFPALTGEGYNAPVMAAENVVDFIPFWDYILFADGQVMRAGSTKEFRPITDNCKRMLFVDKRDTAWFYYIDMQDRLMVRVDEMDPVSIMDNVSDIRYTDKDIGYSSTFYIITKDDKLYRYSRSLGQEPQFIANNVADAAYYGFVDKNGDMYRIDDDLSLILKAEGCAAFMQTNVSTYVIKHDGSVWDIDASNALLEPLVKLLVEGVKLPNP